MIHQCPKCSSKEFQLHDYKSNDMKCVSCNKHYLSDFKLDFHSMVSFFFNFIHATVLLVFLGALPISFYLKGIAISELDFVTIIVSSAFFGIFAAITLTREGTKPTFVSMCGNVFSMGLFYVMGTGMLSFIVNLLIIPVFTGGLPVVCCTNQSARIWVLSFFIMIFGRLIYHRVENSE